MTSFNFLCSYKASKLIFIPGSFQYLIVIFAKKLLCLVIIKLSYIPLDYLQMGIHILCSVSNGVVNDKVSLIFVNSNFMLPCGLVCSQCWVNLCSFSLKVVTDLSNLFSIKFFLSFNSHFFHKFSVLFAHQVVSFTE